MNINVMIYDLFILFFLGVIHYFVKLGIDYRLLLVFSLISFALLLNLMVLKKHRGKYLDIYWYFPLLYSVFFAFYIMIGFGEFAIYLGFILFILISLFPREYLEIFKGLTESRVIVIIILILLISVTTSLRLVAWAALGPFTELLIIVYMGRIANYNSSYFGYLIREVNVIIASLINPLLNIPLTLYSFVVNNVKAEPRFSHYVYDIVILDMIIRFLLAGGAAWITDMLSSV